MKLRPEEELPEPPRAYQNRTAYFITAGKSGTIPAGDKAITVVASSPGRAILDIDAGLGKSLIAILSAIGLSPNRRILVLCSKKALNTWRREWPKWTTLTRAGVTIVEGTPAKRKKLWARNTQIHVVTFQSGKIDWPKLPKSYRSDVEMVIGDEVKLWRNRKTKNFEFWAPILRQMPYVLLMDGTLVSKGPQDLWTFLSIIKPKMFRSYWKFVNTFCIVIDGVFGKEIVGPKNTEGLGKFLRHTLVRLRETDPEIAAQRPPLTRDFKLVDMTAEQQDVYKQLTEELLAITPGGEVVAAPSGMALTVRLRQLLICPKILDPTMGYGGAVEHLLLEMEDDPHSVIFTPFAKAIPYLCEAITGIGLPEPYILKGGTPSEEVGRVENEFNTKLGATRAVISTVGFAESYELYTARQCFFVGYDWSQLTNYQAEKRLHRLITPHPINSWYYRYLNTVDDLIMDVLNIKQRNVNITFQHYISAIRRQIENKE